MYNNRNEYNERSLLKLIYAEMGILVVSKCMFILFPDPEKTL